MRTCLIDMPGLDGRLLDRLDLAAAPAWLGELLSAGRTRIQPPLPAVTMPVQATFSTGVTPAEHGIIANGLPGFRGSELRDHFDAGSFWDYRRNVSFWEQSNALLTAPRIWKQRHKSAAMVCVQSSIGAADVVVTPKPEHTPDGQTISNGWSSPGELYPQLREQLGEFPLINFWGPFSGMNGTNWITAAARLLWEWHPTDLQWVYIPQLDYDLQRYGPDDERCVSSLNEVLGQLTNLVERVRADGGRVLVISEYGMTRVSRSCPLNLHLRRAGLLSTTEGNEVDYALSDAFALCDHQAAHVYCRDESVREKAEMTLRNLPEVQAIYSGHGRSKIGLDTDRAGDLVVFSPADAWFEYRWFEDFSQAPEYVWDVDIHRKPGYDPTELFGDPEKKRVKADQPELVRGSHGRPPEDDANFPLLLGADDAGEQIDATEVAPLLIR